MSSGDFRENCGDCGVSVGGAHDENCDVARCHACGGQRFSCNCEEQRPQIDRWTGFWPWKLEAEARSMDLNEYAGMWIPAVNKANEAEEKEPLVVFRLTEEKMKEFESLLARPAQDLPKLRKLLTEE